MYYEVCVSNYMYNDCNTLRRYNVYPVQVTSPELTALIRLVIYLCSIDWLRDFVGSANTVSSSIIIKLAEIRKVVTKPSVMLRCVLMVLSNDVRFYVLNDVVPHLELEAMSVSIQNLKSIEIINQNQQISTEKGGRKPSSGSEIIHWSECDTCQDSCSSQCGIYS